MMRTMKSALAIAALAAVPLTASAQYAENDAPGFYAGGTLGWNNDEESAWRVLGGYQVNRNFAAELGYHDLGQHNIAGFPLNSTAWEVLGVGRLPINDQLAAYGKLGAYRADTRGGGADETNNDLTFGAGVEYALSRNLAARGEWQRYRDIGGGGIGQVGDLDVYNVGLVYRFR